MSLKEYCERFQRLRLNRRDGHDSPHKPSMLLAVIGLAEAGLLRENRIFFAPPLLDRYLEVFGVVRESSDHLNPYFPFFHMRSDGFWHLVAMPTRDAVVQTMNAARSFADIEDNIAYVRLDDELHALLQDSVPRARLREVLITHWFGARASELKPLFKRFRQEDEYEFVLRDFVEQRISEVPVVNYERAARSTAFRRVVTDAYDYRCAASRLRVVLPGDLVLVQAAHLIPHAETQDDDPCNGMALTPDFHWALDRRLIAPGPDFKWHVSKVVDARVPDNRAITSLEGRELWLPMNDKYWPRQDALAACLARMREAEQP